MLQTVLMTGEELKVLYRLFLANEKRIDSLTVTRNCFGEPYVELKGEGAPLYYPGQPLNTKTATISVTMTDSGTSKEQKHSTWKTAVQGKRPKKGER